MKKQRILLHFKICKSFRERQSIITKYCRVCFFTENVSVCNYYQLTAERIYKETDICNYNYVNPASSEAQRPIQSWKMRVSPHPPPPSISKMAGHYKPFWSSIVICKSIFILIFILWLQGDTDPTKSSVDYLIETVLNICHN